MVDVARRNGVVRQTVHHWLRRYAAGGLAGLVDGSSKPQSCPHQMAPEVEARILERRAHPGWGPRTIAHRLGREGVEAVPGRSSVYRCLVRHGLITPQARRRRRADYKRWERSRAMELWQMDVVGGVRLVDGSEAKVVTGVDDHSRFCVSAPPTSCSSLMQSCCSLDSTGRSETPIHRRGQEGRTSSANSADMVALYGRGWSGPHIATRSGCYTKVPHRLQPRGAT